MAGVQIRESHVVKPAKKTWTGTMKLSEFDMVLSKAFVPKLYIYNRPDEEWDPPSVSRVLRESLGKALVHFYPFLGRLRPTEGGRAELVVDDGDEAAWGVPLVEAEVGVDVAELGDLTEAEMKGELGPLFSRVDYSKPVEEMPLLTVQVTRFRCGGVGVGFSWSHAVVDGVGAGHFYSEWTRYARGEALGMTPVHQRSLLRAGEPPISVPHFIPLEASALPPAPLTADSGADSEADGPPPITTLKFPVSKSQIKKLKHIAGNVNNGRPYSRFEVLTAHAWRCASKAKGKKGDKQNAIGIAVDIRKRMNPPLPREYTGNAVLNVAATSEADDLVSNPLGHTCGKIRQTVEKVSGELVWAYLDHQKTMMEKLGEWQGVITPEGRFVNTDVLMVSWLNLSFHKLDFGWGNEAYMASAPQAWEGVACLLDGPEEGSAVVVMCLHTIHAQKFKEYFFEELK